MKKIIFLSILLSSCTRAHVRSWNGNEVLVCAKGRSFSKLKERIDEEAEKHCKGPATPLDNEIRDMGSVTVRWGNIQADTEACIKYKCMPN